MGSINPTQVQSWKKISNCPNATWAIFNYIPWKGQLLLEPFKICRQFLPICWGSAMIPAAILPGNSSYDKELILCMAQLGHNMKSKNILVVNQLFYHGLPFMQGRLWKIWIWLIQTIGFKIIYLKNGIFCINLPPSRGTSSLAKERYAESSFFIMSSCIRQVYISLHACRT